MPLSRDFLTAAQRVRENDDGSIVPIFGLCFLGLMFSIGVAIDSARAFKTSAEISQALDAAALASAKALRVEKATDSEIEQLANTYFTANFQASGGQQQATHGPLQVQIDRERSAVTLSVNVVLPTTIGGLMGVDKFDIPSNSTAIYEAKDVELSMMLDVSGSMEGQKIIDLRAAAADLVGILLAANKDGAKHRIAIAPFSTSVNAGDYSDSVSDGDEDDGKGKGGKKKSKGAGTKCVTERPGANAFTDKSPDDGKFGKKAATCPSSPVFALSEDEDELVNHINGMTTERYTAGHLGIGWAWYLLSPEWDDVWPTESEPKDYDDKETQKAVILMTDGKFNNFYEPSNGNADQQAKSLCDNMKSKNIVVYTVGFQLDDPDALAVLQYCATSPNHFYDAQDGNQLRDTFKTIAKRLSALRLES